MHSTSFSLLRRLSLAAVLAMPGLALAHDYTYLEGGFVSLERGNNDDSGFFIGGSLNVAKPLAVFGEYLDTGDYEQLSLGGLVHGSMTPTVDWIAGASLERAEVGPVDDTGFGVRAGLRWWAVPGKLELIPELRYLDVLNRDTTSLRATGLWRLTYALDVQALVQAGDDDRLGLGVRYNFGG